MSVQVRNTLVVVGGIFAILFASFMALGRYTFIVLPNQELGYVTALNTQYVMNQNCLSGFVSGFHEMFGVSSWALDGLEDYTVNAVKGRYDYRDEDGNPTGVINADLFINAIVEAYPDTAGITEMAIRLMNYVSVKRAEFKNHQDKLLDMLRAYDLWRLKTPRCYFLEAGKGNPSDRLVARIGDQAYRGQAALDKMWNIVLVKEVKESFETGEMDPLSPPDR